MIAGIYARVSTTDQHCDLQLFDLRAFCERNQWQILEYLETGSGRAGARRPVLKQLMKDAHARKFDAVLVWKIDRFGRSLIDFLDNVQELDRAGVRFLAPSQSIDTDQRNPFAKAMMQLMAVFAELERSLIIERVLAGVSEYKRAYAAGKVGAGKPRRSKSGKDLPLGGRMRIFARDEAARLRDEGKSWREIEKIMKIPQSTIRHALKAAA